MEEQNPKPESRNPKEGRSPKTEVHAPCLTASIPCENQRQHHGSEWDAFRISGFGFLPAARKPFDNFPAFL